MQKLIFVYETHEITIERLEDNLYRMILWERVPGQRNSINTVWEAPLKHIKINMKLPNVGNTMVHASILTQLDIRGRQ